MPKNPESKQDREGLLRCPKCASPMQPVVHQDTEVDRCTNCQGLWFDLLEHEDLKRDDDSENLDLGDAAKGKTMDKVQDIQCPVCRTAMLKMIDRDRKDIHFEACATCYGVFFDAGEFRDWKKHHAFDWLKSLLARERK
ncbi:MAG: zf-TFIIB domain-containing protein [Elusimicrobia bacterium]|nr:zf-TFIIB domain-containing protein [Elusimicrobiota bacterium]